MPRLVLVRHGQTVYNAQRRYQGQTDNPLNATGLAQAEALRPRLATLKLDAAYASDLIRARHTAEIALQNHPDQPQLKLLTALREASGGGFEGLTWDEIVARYPEEAVLWQKDKIRHGPPGGENMEEVEGRVKLALEQILAEHPAENETILVSAHGGILGIMLCYLMGMDLNRIWQWRIDTCSITILDLYQEGAILSLFNDVAHLDPSTLEHREPFPATQPETKEQAETTAQGIA